MNVPREEPTTTDIERQAAATLAKTGRLERAIAAFTSLNVKRPETRKQTYAVEIDALGALFRCDEVRDLAVMIDAKGDEEAKNAAKAAREECARVATTPSEAEEARMRAVFHRAADFEPIEAKDAGSGYAQAWEIAPTLAALLGLARTAKMRGDAALAERTYERALAYSERSDQKARVAIGPVGTQSDPEPSILDVGETSARVMYGHLVATMDLKTGALGVDTLVPTLWNILAGHGDLLVIARSGRASLLRIGLDDARTSTPVELGDGPTVFSADGALVGQVADGHATVVDVKTGKAVARVPLGTYGASRPVGFTDDHTLVVSKPDEICTIAARGSACVSSKDLARDGNYRATTLAGHILAFQPNPSTFVVYDLAKKKTVTTLQGHFGSVDELVLWPDASKLLSLSERRTVVWDLATKKRADRIFTHTNPHFTPDAKHFIAQAGMGALVVRDTSALLAEGAPLAVGAFMSSNPPPEIAFEPDGRLFVRATFDTARVDLSARTVEWTPHDYETTGPLLATVVSPDKKWKASVANGLIHANDMTIEIGPDAAVFTDESGHAHVSGNEASARCVVGDDWLPLDACRDRLLR